MLVVNDNQDLVGILSERDYMQKVILKGLRSHSTLVQDIMTPNPITVNPTDSLVSCLEMITKHRFRHLPVKDEHGKLIGLVFALCCFINAKGFNWRFGCWNHW